MAALSAALPPSLTHLLLRTLEPESVSVLMHVYRGVCGLADVLAGPCLVFRCWQPRTT